MLERYAIGLEKLYLPDLDSELGEFVNIGQNICDHVIENLILKHESFIWISYARLWARRVESNINLEILLLALS